MSRERPDLRLEEVAQRIHRGRVIAMPGEVAEQPLRLVAGPERQRLVFGGKIEQNDHPLTRHDVADPVRIMVSYFFQQAVDRVRDVDRQRWDAELVDDELRMSQAVGTRSAIRHAHADDVFPAERLGGEKRGERRIDAAGQTDDALLEPAPTDDLIPQETHQPLTRELGVDGQGIGFLCSLRDDIEVRGARCAVRWTAIRGGIEPHFLIMLVAAQTLREHRQRAL